MKFNEGKVKFKALAYQYVYWIVQIGANQWWRQEAWTRGQNKSGRSIMEGVPYATAWYLSKGAKASGYFNNACCIC